MALTARDIQGFIPDASSRVDYGGLQRGISGLMEGFRFAELQRAAEAQEAHQARLASENERRNLVGEGLDTRQMGVNESAESRQVRGQRAGAVVDAEKLWDNEQRRQYLKEIGVPDGTIDSLVGGVAPAPSPATAQRQPMAARRPPEAPAAPPGELSPSANAALEGAGFGLAESNSLARQERGFRAEVGSEESRTPITPDELAAIAPPPRQSPPGLGMQEITGGPMASRPVQPPASVEQPGQAGGAYDRARAAKEQAVTQLVTQRLAGTRTVDKKIAGMIQGMAPQALRSANGDTMAASEMLLGHMEKQIAVESRERNARQAGYFSGQRSAGRGQRLDRNQVLSDFKNNITQTKQAQSVQTTSKMGRLLDQVKKNPNSPATWKQITRFMVKSVGGEVGAPSNFDMQTALGEKTVMQQMEDLASGKVVGGPGDTTAADVIGLLDATYVQGALQERTQFRSYKQRMDEDYGPGGMDEDPLTYMRMYRHAEGIYANAGWWKQEKADNPPLLRDVPAGAHGGGAGPSRTEGVRLGGDVVPAPEEPDDDGGLNDESLTRKWAL